MSHLDSRKQAPCGASSHVCSPAASSSHSLTDLIWTLIQQETTEVQFRVPRVHLVFVYKICTCWYAAVICVSAVLYCTCERAAFDTGILMREKE